MNARITSLGLGNQPGSQRRVRSSVVCLFALLSMLCCSPVHAQKYLSNISGEVSDSTGAKVVGATITARNTLTKVSTKAVSNGHGAYSVPFLTPGTYDLTVTSAGFQTQVRTGIVLTTGTDVGSDFTLNVGSENQSVTVNATGQQLDTESANLGTSFTLKQVTDLPNLGRVPFMVAALAAGAYNSTYLDGKADATLTPFGGGPTAIVANGISGHTRVTINGTPDDPYERSGISGSGTYTGFTPSPEAVQEVKAQTSLYDAEYGHGGGTVINTVLRSGANNFHGAAYFVFRNTHLDANTYERIPNQNNPNPSSATPRVNDTWNQPGFVIDGPITIPHLYHGRDKTYFMVAYEHLHQNTRTLSGAADLVPTPEELGGDFSKLCPGGFGSSGTCLAGGGVQIYDPLTLDASNNRTPFKYNLIPAGRISAVGAALLKFFPAPNSNQSAVVNYLSTNTGVPKTYYSFATRVDQILNARNRLNAIFYKELFNAHSSSQGFPTTIGPPNTGSFNYRNDLGGGLDYISILPHDWVLDGRIGVIYHPFGSIYAGNPYDISTLGINSTGIAYQTFPGISFSDSYVGLQPGSGSQVSTDTLGSAALIAAKTIGKHDLHFGFEGEMHRYNAANPVSGLGNFQFDRQFTQKNSINTKVGSDAASGNPIASLLLGYPSSGSYAITVANAVQQPYQAYFIQDNWRALHNLTLNIGLRWDYEAPYTDRRNELSTGFCTTCTNPLQNSVPSLQLLGGLQFASASNRHYYQPEYTNWQPRFGASYQVNSQLVFHGGIGLIYFNSFDAPISNGFSASTDYIASNDNTHPANAFANPFPSGIVQPSGSSLGLATGIGQSFSFMAPDHRSPRSLQWSTSMQAQLSPSTVLQIAYVGNRTTKLETSKNINTVPAQYLLGTAANVTALQTAVPNPIAGLIPKNSTLNAHTIQRQYLLVPFPEFGNLTSVNIPNGETQYNALQTTLNKRMSHHVQLMGSVTWNHEMEALSYLNPTDVTPERSQAPAPTIYANVAVIYQLPTFASAPWYLRAVAGGWQANGIIRSNNGSLIGNPANVTTLTSPALGTPTYNRYFNTCYLNAAGAMVMTTPTAAACDSPSSIPAFQQHYSFTLNTTGPEMTGVRVRSHPNADVSLFKVFRVREQYSFEIRGEFFNVLNTPNFAGPNTSPGNTNFGKVTLTQVNDPRIGQLTARINF